MAAGSGKTRTGTSDDPSVAVKRSIDTDQGMSNSISLDSNSCSVDKDFLRFVKSYKRRRVEEREKLGMMQQQIDDKSQEIDSVRARNRELNLEIAALHAQKAKEKSELERTAETVKQEAVASTEGVWRHRAEASNNLREKEYRELAEKADAYQNELVYLKKTNARYCTENARLFEEIAGLRPGSQAGRKPTPIE